MATATGIADREFSVDAVREHYDLLSGFYRSLWGEHIHHGYWEAGESPAQAQVNLVTELAARAAIPRGARVLDVGCGVGGSAFWLAQNLDCSVTGISISPIQVKMAEQRAGILGLTDRVRFEVRDANYSFAERASFDAVWVVESSEHIFNKPAFIRSCARALAPGGVLALCAWLRCEPPLHPQHGRLIEEICEGMLCPHLASLQEYAAWMRASGLAVIEACDITPHVARTWTRCAELVRRPEVQVPLKISGARIRRFVETFPAMQRAYAERAMSYGMFVARKPEVVA